MDQILPIIILDLLEQWVNIFISTVVPSILRFALKDFIVQVMLLLPHHVEADSIIQIVVLHHRMIVHLVQVGLYLPQVLVHVQPHVLLVQSWIQVKQMHVHGVKQAHMLATWLPLVPHVRLVNTVVVVFYFKVYVFTSTMWWYLWISRKYHLCTKGT